MPTDPERIKNVSRDGSESLPTRARCNLALICINSAIVGTYIIALHFTKWRAEKMFLYRANALVFIDWKRWYILGALYFACG